MFENLKTIAAQGKEAVKKREIKMVRKAKRPKKSIREGKHVFENLKIKVLS